MLLNNNIWLGTSQDGAAVCMLPSMANRHGLISGATGTGKTVTLQVMAEAFSQLGVPVFMADVKGDLAGIAKPCDVNEKIEKRLNKCGVSAFAPSACPVTLWDVYGERGHAVRTTVTEMGPLLLSRMLGLNDTQAGILHLVFRIADDQGLLLIDLKDIRAVLSYVGEDTGRYTLQYGNITKASLGAIQRAIAILEDQGGDVFFGEPAIDISDWLCRDENGRGMVNILSAEKLFRRPVMYSTFMLWMLGELYELLPEQGDKELPRMVFFFDEAHLLFDDCPKMLMERIEQTVRLIRSKGVGVYFVTQNPTDVPSSVLSQLAGRVQHALRAFTPQELKTIKAVAQTFRVNPSFDTEEAISSLKTGEALLSFLTEDGAPSVVQRCTILPPQSCIGAITDDLRRVFMETDAVGDKYDRFFDRESAYELLAARFNEMNNVNAATQVVQPVPNEQTYVAYEAQSVQPVSFRVFNPTTGQYEEQQLVQMNSYAPQYQPVQPNTLQPTWHTNQPAVYQPQQPAAQTKRTTAKSAASSRQTQSTGQKLVNSFVNSVVTTSGREIGRDVTRSLLGVLGLGGTTKRRK